MTKFGRVLRAADALAYYTAETIKTILGLIVLMGVTIAVGVVYLIDLYRPLTAEEMNADGTKDQR